METNHSAAVNRSRHSRRNSLTSEESNGLLNYYSVDAKQGAENHYKSQVHDARKLDLIGDTQNWTTLYPCGNKPQARYYHAAAIIGRKMLVVGGDSDLGTLNDVQQLHLGKLTWSELGSAVLTNEKETEVQRLPACRGHSLLAWGKSLLLIGGEIEPHNENVTVWMFDLENELWSKIEAKGELPVARTGQSVTRAGSVLILFGGEDAKGRKLNDLYMFDLKSFMWLPLHASGTLPPPRAKHVAAMYDDRFLLVFGGASKSKILNDLYALDFETMEWSRLKTRGISPGPRAECASVLVGDKWYLAGGESRGNRCLDTLILDITRMTWSNFAVSSGDSPVASQGFSIVLVQRKERAFLVAFGGKRPGPSNEVQVLHISPPEHVAHGSPTSHKMVTAKEKPSLASVSNCIEHHVEASPPSLVAEYSSHISLCTKFQQMDEAAVEAVGRGHVSVNQWKNHGEDRLSDITDAEACSNQENKGSQSPESRALTMKSLTIESLSIADTPGVMHDFKQGSTFADERFCNFSVEDDGGTGSAVIKPASPSDGFETHSTSKDKDDPDLNMNTSELSLKDVLDDRIMSVAELRKSYEYKLITALKKNAAVDGHLAAALKSKEEAERNLSAVLKSRQKAEMRLAVTMRDAEEMKEKVVAAELAQEEANTLSNIVHTENVRLEHDLAFLKAVLEDTQKELHSTRGVLASERSRAFQLQVELFELKQTIQNADIRHPTTGKKSLHA